MTGETYKMRTIGEVVSTLAKLPPERATVMLDELREALTLAATMQGVLQELGLTFDLVQEFVWIDDDLENKQIAVSVEVEGETVEQLVLNLKPEGAAHA